LRAGAAAAGGFRVRLTGTYIDAHIARQERACGLGLRQLRPRRADRAGGANLEDAQPPRRSHLLVGAIASPALPRDIACVQRHASARVDGHRALGYGPAADLRAWSVKRTRRPPARATACSVASHPPRAEALESEP
jgi:hypothetical protein